MSAVENTYRQADDHDDVLRVDIPLANVSVTPMSASEVARYVQSLIERGTGAWIANHNLHSLYVYMTDPGFRRSYENASRVLIDGWPLLAAAKTTPAGRALTANHRIGSSDWLLHLLEHSTRPLQIVAVGGSPTSSSLAAEAVSRRYAQHTWIAFDGYRFARRDRVDSVKSLESVIASSDLVIVGMGMPQQELWIMKHWELLEKTVVANVGGCIDYISGTQSLAPRWMGRIGCEWLFRLACAPRRLFYRYVIEPGLLVGLLVGRAIQRKLRATS